MIEKFDKSLPALAALHAPVLSDWRGSLTKMMSGGAFATPGFDGPPRQILHSFTAQAGILRGLHAQAPPFTESKLIFALQGVMYWVVVDLRRRSRTFGAWRGVTLSPDATNTLAVPHGFAHGCLSMSDAVSLLIVSDTDHSPEHGIGIAWDDPELAIDWPLLVEARPRLSDEHARGGSFADFRAAVGHL